MNTYSPQMSRNKNQNKGQEARNGELLSLAIKDKRTEEWGSDLSQCLSNSALTNKNIMLTTYEILYFLEATF